MAIGFMAEIDGDKSFILIKTHNHPIMRALIITVPVLEIQKRRRREVRAHSGEGAKQSRPVQVAEKGKQRFGRRGREARRRDDTRGESVSHERGVSAPSRVETQLPAAGQGRGSRSRTCTRGNRSQKTWGPPQNHLAWREKSREEARGDRARRAG